MAANTGELLKQSTARARMVNLGATGLTPTVTISKNGAAFGALGGSIAEVSSNWYAISLNTTDTNTLGDLAYHFSSGTDPQLCDQVVVDVPGGAVASVTAAVSLSAGDSPVIVTGTASAGGASTITLAAALGADNLCNGCIIKITSGTGAKQARVIIGYVNSTQVATVDRAWTTNPDNTSVYAIIYADATKLDSSLRVDVGSILGQAAQLDSNNLLKVDVEDWAATAVTTPNVAGVPVVDASYLLGTIFVTPAVAGIIDVNVKKINNVAATSVTTVNANVGTTQPVNFTGTAGSALVKGDTVDIAGSAVAAGSAQLGVNVVNWAGQTALLDSNNLPKVDVHAVGASLIAASSLANSAGNALYSGSITGASPTTTTFVDSALPGGDANFYTGRVVIMTSGTQKGQASNITLYNHSTKTITVAGFTTAPVQNDTYIIS